MFVEHCCYKHCTPTGFKNFSTSFREAKNSEKQMDRVADQQKTVMTQNDERNTRKPLMLLRLSG